MSNPDGGECTNHADYLRSGWTGMSPPAVYPGNTVELRANKGNLNPRHHAYVVDYYSRVGQCYPVFIRGSPLDYPLLERTMNPQTNNNRE